MRTTYLGIFLLVALCLAGCGSNQSGSSDPDIIKFGEDNRWGNPDSRGADGEPLDQATDVGIDGVLDLRQDLQGDTTKPDVADVFVPDVPPEDQIGPKDTKPEVVPDVIPDTNPADLNPCGCPPDKPYCYDNVCYCTPDSCPAGQYCKSECVPCTVDSKCGPQCISCAAEGQYCSVEADRCVECDVNHPCGTGFSCIDDKCQGCEALGLCGPNCLKCEGNTPACIGGKCLCTLDSCGAAAQCIGGVCVGCTDSDPNNCGPSCLVCSGANPHCKGGVCTVCNTDASCGPTCQACGSTTPYCRPDGQGCVACLTDTHCGANFHCDGGACIPNCAAQGCVGQSTDAKKCSSATIVGRFEAKQGAMYVADTYNDGNDDDQDSPLFGSSLCWDAQADNFYRIYLIAGDILVVNLTTSKATFDSMLKLYRGTSCDGNGDADLVSCYNAKGDGGAEAINYTATQDGWFTVVVDGRMAGTDDQDFGPYSVSFSLSCSQVNCCCN